MRCVVERHEIEDGGKNATSLLSAASDAGHRIVIRQLPKRDAFLAE